MTVVPPAAPPTRIRPRDRDAILQSLRAGVVPKNGLQHIQVGRRAEIEALLRDMDRVADGGSAVPSKRHRPALSLPLPSSPNG